VDGGKAQAVEQIAAFLLRRQLEGGRDVGEEPPEAGQELRHLRSVVAEDGPERLRARNTPQFLGTRNSEWAAGQPRAVGP
jgi:hypothetical protein